MIKKIIKSVPIVGQAYGIVDTVKVIANITDPIQAVTTAGQMIVEDCLPPQVKYPVTGGFSLSLCLGAAKRVIMRRLA